MEHPQLDRIRGNNWNEWSDAVTDPTEVLESLKAALAIQLKDAGKELQREASDWLAIIQEGVKERMGGRMSGARFGMLLEQARTSMQLHAATMLVEREAALLAGIQRAVLTAAKLAI